ncbi:putative flavin-nucleotide-binding protein [Methanocella conradii HZ254]|uniref:Flavin-nucleotide-binding protein n=1 Tax=Methanocella conradii (strain DSM 24694 / JCM 17849 / CGMCC 1.5162 / HZ254) TaxID=1041930 RepID=H8I840_METCZ|nr:pyridoxamine 5'-phosphate oxidase family protein [Methanocella conradii]AFD00858.1 putative flavin-nucleotide-binding protein [Methanocella conradii HZ254]MDI6897539.1 pyridoxamine 5'-phosphate oxidase family protein [Methanocella conradii]
MPATRYLPELSEKEMLEMLEAERVGRLGLNDEPQPYVVPTDFVYKGGAIYIHSPADGKKASLARKDRHVCFEVDWHNDDVTEYRSVIIRGDIAEVFDDGERREAMRALAEKAARSSKWRAHTGRGSGSIAIFKITIKEMTGIKSPDGGHP